MPKAMLTLDGKVRPCMNYSFMLAQSVDHYSGKPSSDVQPLLLDVTFKSNDEVFPYDLMVDPTKKITGKLDIYNNDSTSILRTLNFEESFVVQYNESGAIDGKSDSIISIRVSCRKAELGGATHDLTSSLY